jgi:maleylacetoacetate isomerase
MSADNPQEPPLHLHSYFRSSCSARLRIACNLKQIQLTYSYINLLSNDQSSASYIKINPSKSVPTLRLQPKSDTPSGPSDSITQSLAALEYLEEAFPDRYPLLPPLNNQIARAQVRTLANIIACDVQPVTNLRILSRVRALGGDGASWAKDFMTEGLLAYEAIASSTAGKFSVGDQVSLADVCLIPAVWGAQRWGVDLNQMPVLMRVYENMSKIEAVDRAHWERQEDTPEALRRKSCSLLQMQVR